MINAARARRCLDCAEFAYLDRSKLNAALRGVGIALLQFYEREDTQAFLAFADGELYLSFPGTASLGDVLSDLNYVKDDFEGGGRVHQGVLRQFRLVEPLIAADLRDFKNTPLNVTGHSLGAGNAQLAGVRFEATEGYVFGSLRVGNSDFVRAVNYPLTRFEHRTDPVTFLPPRTSPRQVAHALWHGRFPTLYDRAGTVILTDGNLHRMVHYRPSVTNYLNELERLMAT